MIPSFRNLVEIHVTHNCITIYLFKILFDAQKLILYSSLEAIDCYQCSSTDHEEPYTCPESFNEEGDPDGYTPDSKPCDQVHGASYCIKQTGRFEGILFILFYFSHFYLSHPLLCVFTNIFHLLSWNVGGWCRCRNFHVQRVLSIFTSTSLTNSAPFLSAHAQ
jgi:hypothetical protein